MSVRSAGHGISCRVIGPREYSVASARIAGCRSSDAEVAENEARRRLRARDDPRNTSAGMRARAGKIEVLDARVAVVPAKIGALQQCWRQADGAPEMRGEILRSEEHTSE